MSNTDILPRVYFALVVDGEVASLYFISQCLEAKVAAFLSNPSISLTNTESELYNTYNVSVDGEDAETLVLPKSDEMTNAIFQSNPTIVQLTEEQLEIGVGPGWFWNGTEFTESP